MLIRNIILCVLSVLAVAVTVEFTFFDFLPSATLSGYAPLVGIGSAVGIGLAFAACWSKWKASHEEPGERQGWTDNPLVMAIGAGLIGVVLIQASALRFVPHLIVLADGRDGFREFTVKSVFSSRECGGGITVEELPFLINRVCWISRDLRTALAPGSKVIVRGRMNWAGIVPEKVEIKTAQN